VRYNLPTICKIVTRWTCYIRTVAFSLSWGYIMFMTKLMSHSLKIATLYNVNMTKHCTKTICYCLKLFNMVLF